MKAGRLAPGVVLLLSLSARRAGAVDAGGRLPEDPAAGAKATQQWREFMAAEERERRLHYDRDRLKEHRAVLKFLVATRGRYDRARTKTAVLAIQRRLPPALDGVRALITRIDHWGNNSNLLGDYDAMLNALAVAYPAARIAALEGNRVPLGGVRANFDRHIDHIKAWLAEAAQANDE